jgi:hypothetical protein
MNLHLSHLLVLSGLTVSALAPGAPGGPPAARPQAPPIPTAVEPGERRALLQSAHLLGKGQFDEATGLLRSLLPGPIVRVYVV